MEIQAYTRKLDITRGKLLWELKANNLYREAFGEGVDTWEEFLRSPEIAISTSEANRMMQMYEYFVIKYKLDEEELTTVPIKSLHHMLPRLKAGEIEEEQLEELIHAGKTLTFNEFKERLQDMQTGQARTYQFSVMKRCNETGNLSRVQDITHEEILQVWPNLNEQD
jgi:hypothetical protein